MASAATFEEPKGSPAARWAMIALAVVAGLALIWYLYSAFTGVHSVTVKNDQPVISPLLPPPPPPPPPPKQEIKPPEPTEKPTPTPTPSPEPKAQAPAPMQMNAEAQAGASGGLAAGSGGGTGAPGSTGTCLGTNCGNGLAGGISDAFYTRNLASALQQRVQRDGKLSRMVFSADFAITVNAAGAVTQARLIRSSGDSKRDQMLLAIIESATGLDTPPASFKFPRRITVNGKRSL